MSDAINIKNKKAYFEFEFIDKFIAGIQLTGTEIKSIREGKVNMNDGWCYFQKNELWIKNLNISTYDKGTHYNHEPLRPRKLLLNKKELKKLQDKIKEKGLTVIPLRLFINDRGFAKLEIALSKGKKIHDKRNTIKEREAKREMGRDGKGRN
ncbi:MAG: SsrA-binding protein SmpB [Chitinophagaceae bacterium]|nr:SsrA-binding protein SmpB [Chitinophagaceae bacterium]